MHHEFAQALGHSRWLMEPTAFQAMIKRADTATGEEILAAVKAYQDREPGPRIVGDVAVIDLCGPITYKSSWFSMYFGGATICDLQRQFRAALADDTVRSILFRCDSPGGEVSMVPEFADEVFAARGKKPMAAVADCLIASAALWITAQVDTIYTSASGQLGSIGVWTLHEDISQMLEKFGVKVTLIAYGAHKVDGNPYEPLADDAKATLQAQVDMVGKEFDAAMARGRGVSLADVRDSFGQGQIFRGRQAIGVGLADKMATISQLIAKLTRGKAVAGVSRMDGSAAIPSLEATTPQADDEAVDPDENGQCPEGYEKGDDGMCHLKPADPADDDAKAAADQGATVTTSQERVDQDALGIAIALGE